MTASPKHKSLKKELGLIDVYAIATGTTLSAGFFLLPGIAAASAGPAMIVSYIVAAVQLIPAMLCLVELSTAMPRAGGAYYFVDRAMGPLMGTISGLGTWLSLIFKTTFALVGIGAYINLFIPGDYHTVVAIGMAVLFGLINLGGTKETGFIQVFLVVGILLLLGGFISNGIFLIDKSHFAGFFDAGSHAIISTAGLVYISFFGITKVTSVAEEVRNPERNLPLGMFLSFATALVVYILGTVVMVGVLPQDQLVHSLTPVADTAFLVLGKTGMILVTIAAIFAFSSVVNVGIMTASRYPLAMSRDHLMPSMFRKLNKKGIPKNSILVTLFLIIFSLLVLGPTKIAKLASTFQLLMFALCCLAVIIMRESKIEAYDPGYKSPFYPWLHIVGIASSFWLIYEMGLMPMVFSVCLIVLSIIWYYQYGLKRVERSGAILHLFERLGRGRSERLEPELRSILKEKGLRANDPYDELITRAIFIDITERKGIDEILQEAAYELSERLSCPRMKIEEGLLEGTKVGATPVSHGAALPHMRLNHIIEPELLIVRSNQPVKVDVGENFWGEHVPESPIHAIFVLISPEDDPNQHLRILANLARHIDHDSFIRDWLAAPGEQKLKEIMLRDERFLSLKLRTNSKSTDLIGKKLKELKVPEHCLIAIIQRGKDSIIPDGNTVLKEGDRLTIIGEPKGIDELRSQYR